LLVSISSVTLPLFSTQLLLSLAPWPIPTADPPLSPERVEIGGGSVASRHNLD
jgi:hypothetical protein